MLWLGDATARIAGRRATARAIMTSPFALCLGTWSCRVGPRMHASEREQEKGQNRCFVVRNARFELSRVGIVPRSGWLAGCQIFLGSSGPVRSEEHTSELQ